MQFEIHFLQLEMTLSAVGDAVFAAGNCSVCSWKLLSAVNDVLCLQQLETDD